MTTSDTELLFAQVVATPSPVGAVVAETGSLAGENEWKFSTKIFDPESRLGYWGYRYYHPDEGRWLNRDPLVELGHVTIKVAGRYSITHEALPMDVEKEDEYPTSTEEQNLYLMLGNDLPNFADMFGESALKCVCGLVVADAVTPDPTDVAILGKCCAYAVAIGVTWAIGKFCEENCPECTPHPKGTTGHLGPHKTKPNAPAGVPRPTHYNLWRVNQGPPPACKCRWNRVRPHYSAIPGQVDLNKGFPVLWP